MASKKRDGPRILLYDIETAPILVSVWSLWQKGINPEWIEKDWYVIHWAAKWYGEDTLYYDGLLNHKEAYKKNPEDDSSILGTLRDMICEADIIVAHNGDKFDLPKLNSRFVINGFLPTPPVKSIDTLKIAKKHFRMTSNKLDELAKVLGVEGKYKSRKYTPVELWQECVRGNKDAFKEMETYNLQDVQVLEDVFSIIGPWDKRTPNFGLFSDSEEHMCPQCGSTDLKKEGFAYTSVSKFQRYVCRHCGKWSRGRVNLLTKEKRAAILTNVSS